MQNEIEQQRKVNSELDFPIEIEEAFDDASSTTVCGVEKKPASTVIPSINYWSATKEVTILTLPFLLSRFISISGSFTNNAIIGRLGTEALAASALISSTQSFLITVPPAALYPISNLASEAVGKNNPLEAGNITRQGLFLSAVLSVPVILLMELNATLLKALGQDAHLSDISQSFFRSYALAVPAIFALTAERQFVFGVSRPLVALASEVMNTGLSIGLGYGFIFGKLGLPPLGIAGLGYADLIASWSTCFALTTYIALKKEFKVYKPFSSCLKISYADLKQLVKMGLPIALQLGTELGTIEATTLMVGWLGKDFLAANQVATQYTFLVIAPVFSLAQASGILVSRMVGERNFLNARRLGYAGIFMGIGIGGAALAIFSTLPRQLTSVFIDTAAHPQVAELATPLFRLAGAGLVADSARYVLGGNLRGFRDTAASMWGAVIGMCLVALPLIYGLGFLADLKLPGVFGARLVGIVVATLITAGRWIYRSERAIRTDSAELPPSQYCNPITKRLTFFSQRNEINQEDETGYLLENREKPNITPRS